MRKLAIAYGNSRQAKKWVNKEITFDELKDRFKTSIGTTESAEEYAKFSKAQKDDAKDHGGFVAPVTLRSLLRVVTDGIKKSTLGLQLK